MVFVGRSPTPLDLLGQNGRLILVFASTHPGKQIIRHSDTPYSRPFCPNIVISMS